MIGLKPIPAVAGPELHATNLCKTGYRSWDHWHGLRRKYITIAIQSFSAKLAFMHHPLIISSLFKALYWHLAHSIGLWLMGAPFLWMQQHVSDMLWYALKETWQNHFALMNCVVKIDYWHVQISQMDWDCSFPNIINNYAARVPRLINAVANWEESQW